MCSSYVRFSHLDFCLASYHTLYPLLCFRFRSRAHRDFVRDATWSPLNHSLLTTVGWDHQVIHHVVPIEPLPAPGPENVAE